MQNQVRLKGGAFLVTAGMAVALLAVDIAPSSAGPFQWLTGRQQDNIQGRDAQFRRQWQRRFPPLRRG